MSDEYIYNGKDFDKSIIKLCISLESSNYIAVQFDGFYFGFFLGNKEYDRYKIYMYGGRYEDNRYMRYQDIRVGESFKDAIKQISGKEYILDSLYDYVFVNYNEFEYFIEYFIEYLKEIEKVGIFI